MKNLIKEVYGHKEIPFGLILPTEKGIKKVDSFTTSLEKDIEMKMALKKVFDKVVGHALEVEFKGKDHHPVKTRKIILEALLSNREMRELALNVVSQCFLHKMSAEERINIH